jgi:hypothetical protein
VYFNKPIGGGACFRVQSVDVLGNHRFDLSRALQLNNGQMSIVWASGLESRPALEFEIPMLDPGGFGGHEIFVVDWLPLLPHAVRPTKVRNTAAGRNSCTRECEYPMGGPKQRKEVSLLSSHAARLLILPRRANAKMTGAF